MPEVLPPRIVRRLFALAAVVSLVGLADSVYLTVQHLTGETAVCLASSGCHEVLASKYAAFGRVPLALLGAVAYFTVFSSATLAAYGYKFAGRLLTGMVLIMFAMTLWLLYVQAFVLHAFCDYCLLSAGIVFALAGLVVGSSAFNPRE